MTAHAIGDEHTPFTRADVLEPQPENFAATQPAKQHRVDHRPVPVLAQRRTEPVNLSGVDHPRQRARSTNQRDTPHRPLSSSSRCQASRHRVRRDVTADDEVVVETGDRGQPSLDRASRQALFAVFDPDHVPSNTRSALRGDERQHIRAHNLGGSTS
ncbi:MAG: hypothetical protein R2754_16970, partial [Microthrixaceae bacterium]